MKKAFDQAITSCELLKIHIIHICIFCRIPLLLESSRSSQVGGGGVHSLYPPPRSTSVYSHRPRNFLDKLLKRECMEISLEYVYVQYVVIGS